MPRQTFQAAHVELRYKTYYAVLYIPKDVRAIIGKTKFSKSTKTGDRNKAERIAAAFTISWKAEIERARLNYENPLIAEAESLLENLRHSSSRHSVVEIIQERTREILEETGEPLISNEFNAIASGKRKSLASIIPEWKIAQTEKGLKQKTIDQMSKDVGLLVKTFTTAELLTAKYTEAWITNEAESKELSPSSVNRIITFCRNFYRYLQSINEAPKGKTTPFFVPDQFKKSKKNNKKSANRTESWLPFKPEELKEIYEAAITAQDEELMHLIKIAAYTGARIEEICSIKISDVNIKELSISFPEAKTAAGIRTIPIHSKLIKTITKLIEESKNDYLFPDLTPNKYGDRSNAIGKRFGRLKRKIGFSRLHVFHSIRKTLTTALENSGIPENLAADIVGHEKTTITYGLYSGGNSLKTMRDALEKIEFDLEKQEIVK